MTPAAQFDFSQARPGLRFRGSEIVGQSNFRSKMSAIDEMAQRLGLHRPAHDAVGRDYFTNAAARTGWGTPSLTETTTYELARLSYNYWLMITLYEEHWISRKIVDVPAQDMIRAWPTVTSEIEPKDIARINRAIRVTKTKQNLLDALKWSRLFGGAGAVIIIDGHENILDEPLNLDDVELGSYRGVLPFDRWAGITPAATVSVDITKPLEFNLPEHYNVQPSGGGASFKVHSSRVLRFCGPSVPTPEYEAYQFWGISALAPAYEEIRKRDNVSWNLVNLSFRANILEVKNQELAQMLSGLGISAMALQQWQQRMSAINHLLSNQNIMISPKEGGLSSTQFNPSGWDQVYQQFQLDISGASEIPVVRLFGRTITGLGQANDADEKIYEERIGSEQMDKLQPQLEKLFGVVFMSELGEVPDDLDLKFPSVRVPDEKEKSELATAVGSTVTQLFGAGIIDKPIALKELKQSATGTGMFTNITDADIEAAEKEKEMQAKLGAMGLAASGGPGEGEPGESEGASAEGDEDEELANLAAEVEREFGGPAKDSDYSADLIKYTFAGFPLAIEYEAGERRRITNDEGEVVYDKLMQYDYGFIRATTGRDGDEIDVIVGPAEEAPMVYIVDMIDLGPDIDQREDEDKVCIGFQSRTAAERAFLSMYPRSFLGGITEVPVGEYALRIRTYARDRFLTIEEARDAARKSQPPNLRVAFGLECCGNCGAFRSGANVSSCAMFGGYPVTIQQVCDEWVDESHRGEYAHANDAARFRENEHPRAKGGEEAGQFVKKGSGSGRGTRGKGEHVTSPTDMKRAPQAEIRPYDESKFRKPKATEKTPGGWTDVRVNPDPKADVQMVGVNQYGKPTVKYSEGFYARQKKEREKWPKWAQEAKIPMPWTDIKLAPSRDSHILATGIDAVGTRKAIYSPEFVQQQTVTKHARVKELDGKIDKIYARVERDRNSKDDVLQQHAQVAELILKYGLRPGGGEQRGSVKSYGAQTLLSQHVVRDGRNGKLYLRFTGKKGQPNSFEIDDPKIAKWLEQAKKNSLRPDSKDWQSYGGWLFPWVRPHTLNQYTKKIGAAKTKDFRTRIGTKLGASAVADMKAPKTAKEFKARRDAVGDAVSKQLCNTRAVALSAYIDRSVFQKWAAGLPAGERLKIKW